MHRSVSILITDIFTLRQRSPGTSSAAVGQATAQGISVHITQA
jgi:hypothetical protein